MFRTEVPSDILQAFGNLSFIDNYGYGKQVQVDILIGLDYYWNFVNPSKTVKIGGLVAQETLFGWILPGSWLNEKRDSSVCVVHQLLCFNDMLEATLRRFWKDSEHNRLLDNKKLAQMRLDNLS